METPYENEDNRFKEVEFPIYDLTKRDEKGNLKPVYQTGIVQEVKFVAQWGYMATLFIPDTGETRTVNWSDCRAKEK